MAIINKNSCRLFLLFILLSIPFIRAYAAGNKGSLSGKITDASKIALPGVIVQIPDLKIGVVSDSEGNYLLENLPKGKYIVVYTLISYATGTENLYIDGATVHNFVMQESAIEKKEVIITGQSKATEIRRSPVPIVAISNDYLQQNLSSNIIDAIATIPGVTAVSTGPEVSKPFIRGLGYNRVLTLYNGMRIEGQQWGDEHGIEADEYNIDRIEVVKGPSSLIYGSDALAGVINLIPTPEAPLGKNVANYQSEFQSNNKMIGNTLMLGGNHNAISWQARVSEKMAQDYQNPVDGSVYATNFRETDASANVGVQRKWGNMKLELSLFNDLQAIPDGSRDSATRQFTKQITEIDTFRPIVSYRDLHTYTLPDLHQHVQMYRALLSNEFHLNSGMLSVNIGFEQSKRQEFSHPEYPDIAGLSLLLNTFTYDLKYFIAEFRGWSLSCGINGMIQQNTVDAGTEFIIPDYKQFDLGPFLFGKKTIGKTDISGGIRFDARSFHNDAMTTTTDPITGFDKVYTGTDTAGMPHPFKATNQFFSGMSFSLGATHNFNKNFSIKANISRGYRAPNIAEISANGVHPGTNIYQIGNSGFQPEFSLQEDIGVDYISRHFSFSVAVFNNSIIHYIFNEKLQNSHGGDSVIIPGNQTFMFNQGSARLYGGELSFDIHPHPLDWLHFENSFSMVNGLNLSAPSDSTKYLPAIPPFHGSSELRVNGKHLFKYGGNAYLKVQLNYYFAQNHVFSAYGTETPTGAYNLVNISGGTDIINKQKKVIAHIALFADNLFNTAYQDHLSRLKYFEFYPTDPRGHYGIYNMGRNIGIKLMVPLQW